MSKEKIYLEDIVKPLLSHPEDLVIDHTVDTQGILLTITTHGDDMGRLIGKLGTTANALRCILRQYGALHQLHISVKINDPLIGTKTKAQVISDKDLLNN